MNDKNILNVYSNEVTEWIVAYSPEDAIKVWEETTGESYDVNEYGRFIKEDDEKLITFFNEDDNTPIPFGAIKMSETTYRATCKEWADTLGRSFFCSTEF